MQIQGLDEATIGHLPHKAAGRRLTKDIPVVPVTSTIGDVEALLLKVVGQFETINYVYVVDATGKLEGVISIKEVFGQKKGTPIIDVMTRELITVRAHTDQEHVALMALKHNIKALPIVDKAGVLLGVVPSDPVLNILHSESVEDALKTAGIRHFGDGEELLRGGTRLNVRRRLPWLLIGLLGGLVAASVVSAFEGALAANILLAAFIPTIVYMADAVGTQAQTILIRSLAVEHEPVSVWTYLRREFIISVIIATLLGGTAWIISALWFGGPAVATVLGSALAATVVAASIIAVLLPFLFVKFHADPAVASGPLATIVRDLMSLLIYFAIASLMFG